MSLFTNAKNVACLDWTQRRHRLAGAAGKELLTAMTNKRWIEPGNRPRASHITQTGRQHITDTDSLTPP